jgi:ketosteroid isomerase-like protein
MTAKTVTQTELTLMRHLQAACDRDLDRILADYTDASVLYTPEGPRQGLAELRTFFAELLQMLPEGWFDAFRMLRREVCGEVGYILWKAEPFIPLATDTFIVRGGKIMTQTFVSYRA